MNSFFCMKVFCEAFFYLHFGIVIFWLNIIDEKAAHKTFLKLTPVMKLTTGVNFTNIFISFYCSKVFCKAFMCLIFGLVFFYICTKSCLYIVGEIECRFSLPHLLCLHGRSNPPSKWLQLHPNRKAIWKWVSFFFRIE